MSEVGISHSVESSKYFPDTPLPEFLLYYECIKLKKNMGALPVADLP